MAFEPVGRGFGGAVAVGMFGEVALGVTDPTIDERQPNRFAVIEPHRFENVPHLFPRERSEQRVSHGHVKLHITGVSQPRGELQHVSVPVGEEMTLGDQHKNMSRIVGLHAAQIICGQPIDQRRHDGLWFQRGRTPFEFGHWDRTALRIDFDSGRVEFRFQRRQRFREMSSHQTQSGLRTTLPIKHQPPMFDRRCQPDQIRVDFHG